MLTLYSEEIIALSKKHIDEEVANLALRNIEEKLPKSKKKRHKILELTTSNLLEYIRNRDYNASFGMLRFVFFTNLQNPMAEARKQGVFRASKTNFNPKLIKELLLELYISQTLSNDDQRYIESVNCLLKIAPAASDFKKKIIAAASSRRYFLKTILTIAETKFSDLLFNDDKPYKGLNTDLLIHNNKENILASISYIIQTHRESLPKLKLRNSNDIDESTTHDFYDNLLEMSFSILNYLEAEIKVDFYNYAVELDETGKNFRIHNEDFETAKSCGYTKSDFRAISQTHTYHNLVKNKGFIELLEEVWLKDTKEKESLFYAIKYKPVERITLNIILSEYGHKINIFSHDYLFKEEQIQLMILMDENYNANAPTTKLYLSFTCLDILKLQRLFGFIAFIYKKAYEKLRDEKHPNAEVIRKRSVLPVFDKSQLISFFINTTGKTQIECESLLTALTNCEPQSDEVIDLQYKPLITIEHRYLVLPTVFAYSNLMRSLAISQKVHFSVHGQHDHMVTSIANAFRNQNFSVKHDLKFGRDEVDIAASYGEHLFLFECKNPYHPVNDFELRNTHAHILKGFSQLKKFQTRFEDTKTLDQFLRNLEINPGTIKKIHYGIINANRTLTGLAENEIKVFHANELINFICSGTITSAADVYHSWKSEKFHVNDLISYMNGEVITNDLICHKLPLLFNIPFRNFRIQFQTYQYDIMTMYESQKLKYRYIGPAQLNT